MACRDIVYKRSEGVSPYCLDFTIRFICRIAARTSEPLAASKVRRLSASSCLGAFAELCFVCCRKIDVSSLPFSALAEQLRDHIHIYACDRTQIEWSEDEGWDFDLHALLYNTPSESSDDAMALNLHVVRRSLEIDSVTSSDALFRHAKECSIAAIKMSSDLTRGRVSRS